MQTSSSLFQGSESPSATAGAVQLVTAVVRGRAGAWFFLAADGLAEVRAVVAASCLLTPEDGDVVLVCMGSDAASPVVSADCLDARPAHHHILAVLTRAAAQAGTVTLPGGARLVAENSHLRVEASGIDLIASRAIQARTPALDVSALQGEFRFTRANASAQAFEGRFGELRCYARHLTSVVERLVQKARNSFRQIEDLDDMRAGRARWDVEGHAQLHAQQATVLAEGRVKIDGERIDLG